MSYSISNMIIMSLLFILCVSFPIETFTDNIDILYSFYIVIRLVFLLYLINSLNRSRVLQNATQRPHFKHLAILSPIVIACFVTPIYYLIKPEYIAFNFNKYFYLNLLLDFLTAINEELVFRAVIHPSLRIKNRLVKIIASSGIFAAFHLLNFVSSFDPVALLDILYAFGVGMLAGFVYEYGHNIYFSIGIHFLFNAINSTLLNYSLIGIDVSYYILGIAITVIVGLYLLGSYLFYFKKKEFF